MAARRIALAGFGLAATICFLALGWWQVERRTWKLDLIERVDARIHAAAVPLPPPGQWPSINERGDAYRKVRVDGVFQHECETPVQALTERGAGYWLLTPLRTADGVVLVNRGFVPSERDNPGVREAGRIAGPVTVTGLMRMTEPKGTLLRSNDPAAGRWFSRDAEAILRKCGIDGARTFFIDADATPNPGGYPVGGLTVIAFSNSHFVYAVTWFTLALMSMAGIVLLFRKERVR
ncbi:MAG: SURF1 family protein [Pseudolabrys sp.]|nr:SURF1 family protein [Pseudolabrys sp.]